MALHRKQQTDTLPLGDAIELYVQTLHQRRRPTTAERREELDRLALSLGNALNRYEVEVTLSCRFMPGQSFESLGPGEDMSPMTERLKDGAAKNCCGVPAKTPTVLGKPQSRNPFKRK